MPAQKRAGLGHVFSCALIVALLNGIMKSPMGHSKDRKLFSQGFEKLLKHYQRTVDKESFQGALRSLRKKFKIPKNGFNKPEYYQDFPHTPWKTPENWEFKSSREKQKELANELKKLAKEFEIESIESRGVALYQLIFYDMLILKNTQGYCRLEKANNVGVKNLLGSKKKYRSLEESDYVMALFINPDATQRDVIDHIQKNWSIIEKTQRMKKKTGEKQVERERAKEKRDEFIYQNKHLNRQDIVSKVAEKFDEVLEYTRISQIIAKVRKRKE